MTPKQTKRNGKACWTIDLRSEGKGRLFAGSREEVLRKMRKAISGVDRIEFDDNDRLAKHELGDRGTLLDAVRSFLAQKPPNARKKISAAIEECVAAKTRKNCRPAYLTQLRFVLSQFLRTRSGDVWCSDIAPRHIDGFLESKPWAQSSRVGMRNRLSAFFAFCVKQGYCATNPVDATEAIVVEKKLPTILTVEQAHRLLDTALVLVPTMVPFFALGMFCGIRPEELARLSNDNVKVKQGIVDIPPHVSKTRDRRIVEISENARAWLRASDEPLRFSRRYRRLAIELAHVEWSADVLRHTFASYHIAMHQSADKTALELGHQGSTKMLFRHYKATVTKEDAEAFWKIEPLPMLFLVKRKAA